MIKCNLAVLMAERGLKIQDIADRTKMSRTTIAALYHNNSKGVQFDTMDSLCDILKCTPSDLFTYEPIVFSFLVEKKSDDKLIYILYVRSYIKYKNSDLDFTFAVHVDLTLENDENENTYLVGVFLNPSYPKEITELSNQIPKNFWTAIENELSATIVDYLTKDYEVADNIFVNFR